MSRFGHELFVGAGLGDAAVFQDNTRSAAFTVLKQCAMMNTVRIDHDKFQGAADEVFGLGVNSREGIVSAKFRGSEMWMARAMARRGVARRKAWAPVRRAWCRNRWEVPG